MDNLVIPPSANWYESAILACAPDNTLIYGSRSDIIIIYDSPNDQPSSVKIIPRAHSQKIVSTSLNKNWGQPHKLAVTVGEDNIVKLWDIETRKKKLGHNAHIGQGKVIGATFAGDDRVISVSEEGIIIVWNIPLNKTNVFKDIFGLKVTVTCISTCPHANWLTAFGLKNGLVIVTDLRRQGKVLYKLRGHDKSVLSLSWCPVPINIFPRDPSNYVGVKSVTTESNLEVITAAIENESFKSPEKESVKVENGNVDSDLTEIDNIETVSDVVKIEKNKSNRNNIWSNLKHADDDEHEISNEEPKNNPVLESDANSEDFLKECENLKKIITRDNKLETTDDKCSTEKDRVIIKAKRNATKGNNKSQKVNDIPDTFVDVINDASDVENDLMSSQNLDEANGTDENLDIDVTIVKTSNLEDTEKLLTEIDTKSPTNTSANEIGAEIALQANEKLSEGTISEKDLSGSNKDENLNESDDKTGAINEESDGKLEKAVHVDGKITCGEAKREIPLNVPVEEEPRREFLLASSGKEGNIYIWRAGTDGRMQTFLTIPNKSGYRRSNKSNFDKLWVVLCWIAPTILLSSSKSAELVKWTLPKPKDKNKQSSVIHCDHNSILFSIAAPIGLYNEHNWLEERKLNVWTVGHDRLLLNTSLESERKNLACYPTMGKAECLALSPVDPNRLAIGTAEGVIKVWDLSRPSIKNIVMMSFFQKIQSKVVTLAWHPTDELILAYGTVEGRVGFIDTVNNSKMPTVPPNFFKSQIHGIEWGPISANKEELGLFAAAEGKLVIYTGKRSEKAPTVVDTPDDTYVYTFAWKPDYTMLLVGSKTGTVILYSPELRIISTHYFQHRLKDIYWHPDAVQSDLNFSKYCYWFAAISNSKDVIVCNFQSDIEDGDKVVAKYESQDDTLNSVAWSPYASNELVISSDEGTAQVWNAEDNEITTTYASPNFEGVLAAIWSPIDSDYVISAVKDHTVRVWKISDYPKRDAKEIKDLRKKVVKEIAKEQVDLLPKAEKAHEEAPIPNKTTKVNLLPNFFYAKDTPQVISDLRKLFCWKEGLNGTEMGGGDNSFDILKIFGTKSGMLDVMEQNEIVHQEKGKYILGNTVSLFKGDISSKIKKAIDERRVSPWIIMMAPMVSPKLWQSACEVYAQQLSETADSNPIEAATFYLACHKVEEAIDALCDGTMYREALALAKCRLPEDSPAVTKIMERWAKHAVVVGNFEAAAQCHIYLGKYGDAASVLFRRSDEGTLKFASELAEKSGNEELHKAVLFRYNAYKSESSILDKQKQLLSKLDVILQQHVDSGCDDKEVNLDELDRSDAPCLSSDKNAGEGVENEKETCATDETNKIQDCVQEINQSSEDLEGNLEEMSCSEEKGTISSVVNGE